ncbi:MarR family transcriptional regulator [Intrasporangium sp.]|uniref:MarR family winged helix-turn-helix transcriptional regulator n=1 Tax=Intrasporangium sp. TaxID=1925024 RepID=UPI00336572D4
MGGLIYIGYLCKLETVTSQPNPANDLLRAAARLSRWASQNAAFAIPFAQARLLGLIEDHEPVRVSALAGFDHSSQPTITTQLQRMDAAGWVRRDPDPEDARATLVTLTAAGTAAIAEVRTARAAVLEPFISRLDGPAHERVRLAVDVINELLELTSRDLEPRED